MIGPKKAALNRGGFSFSIDYHKKKSIKSVYNSRALAIVLSLRPLVRSILLEECSSLSPYRSI
jgi:hypothetical protein